MRRLVLTGLVLTGLVLVASPASAMQRRSWLCQSITGAAIPACSITVYNAGTLSKSTIYSDQAGSSTLGNPITAGSDGTYTYYAANGRYTEVLSASGFTFGSAQTQDFILNDPFVAASPVAATGAYLNASATCANIPNPVAGQTWCFDQTRSALTVYDGTKFATATSVNAYVVNVKDYGATGDGSTDDTNAWLKAIAAATASGAGGTVNCPSGVYKLTATLTITTAVRIIGLGTGPGGNTIVGNNDHHACILEHNFNGTMFSVTGVSGNVLGGVGTAFENLLLRQTAGTGTGAKGTAINLVGASDTFKPSWTRIRNVTFETVTGGDDWTYCLAVDGSALATGASAGGGLRDTWVENIRCATTTLGTGAILATNAANLFVLNAELNGTNAIVSVTGPDAARASSAIYMTQGGGATLALDQAANVRVAGGGWTSVTTTANVVTSQIFPNFIANTPSVPPSGTTIAAYLNALGKYAVFTAAGDAIEYRTSGQGFRNGTSAYVGTLDAQTFNLLTNGATMLSIPAASTGNVASSGGMQIAAGSFAAGAFYFDATHGAALSGKTGATNDFSIFDPSGNFVLKVPTGTQSVVIPTSGLQVGAPTSGNMGIGTSNASAYYVHGTAFASMVLTNASGTRTNVPHMVQDTVTLTGGTAGVALAGAAAFTNSTSYTCVCDNDSAVLACRVVQNGGNGFTVSSGAGTDVVRFICAGS